MEGNIFGKNLRRLRISKKLSLRALGEILGVTSSAVSSWELGNKEPNYDMLKKIATYLEVSIDYLLSHQSFENEDDKKEIVSQLANEIYERYRNVPDSKKAMVKHEIIKYMNYLRFQAQNEDEELKKLELDLDNSNDYTEK